MRVGKSKSLYNFQKGVILSSLSLKGLYEMLQRYYNLNFVMTTRLNQDCLEHFFGCIRQMSGPQDHPDAVNFKHRLRKYVLGRDVRLVSEKTNICEDEKETHVLDKTVPGETSKHDDQSDSELALEICLTTLVFKDLEVDINKENDQTNDDVYADDENFSPEIRAVISTESEIEDESLAYIGGYIVRNSTPNIPI